ncbi:MAG: HpcH/HpaI aldolase/citrate lyase family protein [Bacteroidales bacterium]|nr:HpcH/HpaI aldolase/citrate lyase family protein [Bacteroidales bacterium]MBN2632598.1 HpcH/HpaI aldolase/citrate lyase family protein [Bacteroidales bacterium]
MKNAFAGNTGPKVRSDCGVTLEIKHKGGITIDLKSKVGTLYGESISALCREVLAHFMIRDAELLVEDSGALPFVIMARLEAAIKKLTDSDREYLPVMLKTNIYSTEADRTRFSRLYLPGNNPALMINAGLHSADGIILDLEDSVAPEKKDEARLLVRNALRQIDFRGAERMVRINQGKTGLEDLKVLIPNNVNLVLIPKCDTAEQVQELDSEINKIRTERKLKNRTFLMPVVESAYGVENAFSIAGASENVVAMAIGLEDFTADLGVQRTLEGSESFYARTRIVNAAKAARIQPIDSVFSDVADIEGLTHNVARSKALGFEGMGCIHPRQIRVINKGFAPSAEETEKALKIVLAWEDAKNRGLGVVALGTKMIDAPVVARAMKTINLAVKLGMIPADRKKE